MSKSIPNTDIFHQATTIFLNVRRWKTDCIRTHMMSSIFLRIGILGSLLIVPADILAAEKTIPLDDTSKLQLVGVKAEKVQYRGRAALKLTEGAPSNDDALAVIKDLTIRDGTIEVELAGAPAATAGGGARGFVGIAFHIGSDAKKFEYLYLRPTNGRADDQVRRNHSVQYASYPAHGWQRLRKEEPEKYESYVDLEPGVWTKVRIVVSGTKALLYVHGAAQPTLVVNDLKLGAGDGGIGLWIGPGTEAHFSNLSISAQ
jgi:hypothetical protein